MYCSTLYHFTLYCSILHCAISNCNTAHFTPAYCGVLYSVNGLSDLNCAGSAGKREMRLESLHMDFTIQVLGNGSLEPGWRMKNKTNHSGKNIHYLKSNCFKPKACSPLKKILHSAVLIAGVIKRKLKLSPIPTLPCFGTFSGWMHELHAVLKKLKFIFSKCLGLDLT